MLFLNKKESRTIQIRELKDESRNSHPDIRNDKHWKLGAVKNSDLSAEPWQFNIGPVGNLFESLSENPKLGEEANVFMGTGTRADDVFLLEQRDAGLYSPALEETVSVEDEILRPGLKGSDIEKYHFDRDHRLIFPYEEQDGEYKPLNQQQLKTAYPDCWDYLNQNKKELKEREGGRFKDTDQWYVYGYPRSMAKLGQTKIVLPDVVNEAEVAFDSEGWHILDTAYGIISESHEEKYLSGILNSDLLTAFLQFSGTDLRGGYFRMKTAYLNPFPIPEIESVTRDERLRIREKGKELYSRFVNTTTRKCHKDYLNEDGLHQMLVPVVEKRGKLTKEHDAINLNLLDYVQPYSDGPQLIDVGTYQPPEGVGNSLLAATKQDRENLRVGTVSIERDGPNAVTIYATARYKPDDEDAHETDRWGYTETEPMPAMRLTDLTETEADLIEAFVPVAVEEADGFAGFRETATKTNSLVDRLEAITLPDPDDVAEDLARYVEAVERAEKLDGKIERTDALIDEIVYELYGLTEEEIEIVEAAVRDE